MINTPLRTVMGDMYLEFDEEIGAVYIRLCDIPPKGAVETRKVGNVNFDYNQDGFLIGIEVI